MHALFYWLEDHFEGRALKRATSGRPTSLDGGASAFCASVGDALAGPTLARKPRRLQDPEALLL